MKQSIKYAKGVSQNKPVINIAGRDYVVMPYIADAHVPSDLFEFVKRHPERDDVNRMLQHIAEGIVQDVVRYLRDAMAVTIAKSEQQTDEDEMTDYDVFLPVLMPIDTKERWNGDPLEVEKRIKEENFERQQTGKPYIFKFQEMTTESFA